MTYFYTFNRNEQGVNASSKEDLLAQKASCTRRIYGSLLMIMIILIGLGSLFASNINIDTLPGALVFTCGGGLLPLLVAIILQASFERSDHNTLLDRVEEVKTSDTTSVYTASDKLRALR